MTKQDATEKVRQMVIDARTHMGLSRTRFAQQLNTKPTNVTMWEEGKVSPSSPTLLMILELKENAERS